MMWSALVLGIMGSLHCLAMCGPLVIALNTKHRQSSFDKIRYNSGRIFTYVLLGGIAGILGSGIEWMAGQQFLSVFSGTILILGLLVSWLSRGTFSPLSSALVKIKTRMSTILSNNPANQWWFGMYNGLLPCGLTYVALAAAASTGSVPSAMLYMLLFGIGTSPMMWMIVSGFHRINLKSGSGNKLITGFTWVLALLLIVRGLGLGIPYLSPDGKHKHEMHMSTDH